MTSDLEFKYNQINYYRSNGAMGRDFEGASQLAAYLQT